MEPRPVAGSPTQRVWNDPKMVRRPEQLNNRINPAARIETSPANNGRKSTPVRASQRSFCEGSGP